MSDLDVVVDLDNVHAGSIEDLDDSDNSDNSDETTIYDSVPEGAMSVPDFASKWTTETISAKVASGETLDGSEYLLPQKVYQKIKGTRERFPHILVKSGTSDEPRVFVFWTEAAEAWRRHVEGTKERGTAVGRVSTRTPDELMVKLGEAHRRALYAADREAMWSDKRDKATNLVEKYKGWLRDANVSVEEIDARILDAAETYSLERAAKRGSEDNSDNE